MKAVYSFWGKPFWISGGGYSTGRHFLSLLGLSVQYARRNFSSVSMYCCSDSYQIFKDLGWFDEVIIIIDDNFKLPARHWAICKMITFSVQTEPFLHIDNDAFISSPLPRKILFSPIISQSVETYQEFHGTYIPQVKALTNYGIFPRYWHHDWISFAGQNRRSDFSYNTGVFGGCDLESIIDYAKSGVDFMMEHGKNIPDINTTIEQAYLGMFSNITDVPVKVLLSDWRNSTQARALGFKHYWGGTKRDKNRNNSLNLDVVAERFSREYPEYKSIISDYCLFFNKT